jgi:hypothetical protein
VAAPEALPILRNTQWTLAVLQTSVKTLHEHENDGVISILLNHPHAW